MFKRLKNKFYFNRNVVAMGLVSFFNDVASEMIYPIIPIFLSTVLGAPATVIGLIEGIAESTASLLKTVSGWLSDKFKKRKIFVTFGYSFSAISKIILGVATTWPLVLVARFIDRFGKGTRTSARDALILESVTPQTRGRAFGFHRALDSLGAVIGPLLALAMIYFFKYNFRLIFLLAFIPAFIGVILLLLFVKEIQKKNNPISQEQKEKAKFQFKWSDLNFDFKFFIAISIIFSIGNSSDAFLILRSQNLGLTATATVTAYVLYNLAYSLFSYPAGAIADKIGTKKVLIAGFFLFALVYLFFGLIKNPFYIWLLFPLYGVYIALTDGISRAYISDTVPVEKSGTAFGIYQTAVGICVFFSSLLAGVLWNFFSPAAPFLFGALTSFIAVLLFLTYNRN